MIAALIQVGYRVVYDARNDPWVDWGSLVLALFMSAVGWGVHIVGRRAQKGDQKKLSPSPETGRSPAFLRVFGAVAGTFGLAMAALIGTVEYQGRARLRRALERGTYVTAEGVVSDFRVTPQDRETWTVQVGDKRYEYSYSTYDGSPGYRRTQARGGQVRNGVAVRVADVDGRIARLEIHPRQ